MNLKNAEDADVDEQIRHQANNLKNSRLMQLILGLVLALLMIGGLVLFAVVKDRKQKSIERAWAACYIKGCSTHSAGRHISLTAFLKSLFHFEHSEYILIMCRYQPAPPLAVSRDQKVPK